MAIKISNSGSSKSGGLKGIGTSLGGRFSGLNQNDLTQGRIPSSSLNQRDLTQGMIPTKPKTPARKSSGGGGGGGSYGGGGGGSYSTFGAVDTGVPTEEDYLAGDATYQATLAALAKQLQNFTTDIDTQLSNRKIDYDNALGQLGWIGGVDGAAPSWNFNDQNTASGRSYQQMLNDYAARGMIQSQAFGDAQNDLTRSLNKQYEGMNTANQQFIDDMGRQRTKASDENTAATQAARAEAIMRRAAQYGFGV